MHPDRLNTSSRYLIHGYRYKYFGEDQTTSGKPLFIFEAAHPFEQPAVIPFRRSLTLNELTLYVIKIRE